MPGRINPFDQPDDYFRIRLISTVLETCGMFFNKGAAGKKLDYFLSFFQYYIHTKNPLPMDIEFLVQDIFALTRPQWKLASNIEEATKVFQFAVAQDQKTSGLGKVAEQDDATSGDSSDDENGDDMPLADQDDDDESSSEDGEAEAEVNFQVLKLSLCEQRLTASKPYRMRSRTSRTTQATPRTKRLSSPERKRRSTLKTRLTLTGSMPRSWLRASRHASSSRSNKSTSRFPSGPRTAKLRAAARWPRAGQATLV